MVVCDAKTARRLPANTLVVEQNVNKEKKN